MSSNHHRKVYIWAFHYFDGALLGSGIGLIPYLIRDRCFTNFNDNSDPFLLLILSGVVFLYYIGKMIGIMTAIMSEEHASNYVFYFSIISLIVFPSLILYGCTSDLAWLLATRVLAGVLSGYSGRVAILLDVKNVHYAAWIMGLGLSCCISGLLYATSDYEMQPIGAATKDLVMHPAIVSASANAAILLLILVRVRCEKVGRCASCRDSVTCNDGYDEVTRGDFLSLCHSKQTDSLLSDNNSSRSSTYNILRKNVDKASPISADVPASHESQIALSSSTETTLECARKLEPVNLHRKGAFEKVDISSIHDRPTVSPPKRASTNDEVAVESTAVVVPSRYLRGCGEYEEAKRRWLLTLSWRKEFDVDSILSEPQPDFDVIKQYYPHFIHGESKFGQPVYYELLGKINIAKLQEHGIGVHKLLRYYVFITEYIWEVVEPDEDFGQLVTILDVEGVGVADLMGDALEFMKEASKVIQGHYVERCKKMFIVNAPFFFNMLWRIVSPMLHENTRRKISILGTDKKELLEYIDANHLPEAYGGTGSPLGTSEAEYNLRKFVERSNRQGSPDVPTSVLNIPTLSRELGDRSRYLSDMSEYETETEGELGHSSVGHGNEIGKSIDGSSFHSTLSSPAIVSRQSDRGPIESSSPTHRRMPGSGLVYGLGSLIGTIGGASLEGVKRLSHAVGSVALGHGSAAKQAHLGEENAFEFDSKSGVWVLRKPESAVEDTSYEDECEKRLVRAIQAAQGLVNESDFGEEEEITLFSEHPSVAASNHIRSDHKKMPGSPARNPPVSGDSHLLRDIESDQQQDRGPGAARRSNRRPQKNFSLLVVCLVWKAFLTMVLEMTIAVMFLAGNFFGLALPPVALGLVLLSSCLLLLAGREVYQYTLASSDRRSRIPLGTFRWSLYLMVPAVIAMISVPFVPEWARVVITCLVLSATIGGSSLATMGTSLASEPYQERASLICCIACLAEGGASALGLLLLRASIDSDLSMDVAVVAPFIVASGVGIILSAMISFVSST